MKSSLLSILLLLTIACGGSQSGGDEDEPVREALIFRWTPPDMYTDGTTLYREDIDFFTIYCNGLMLAFIEGKYEEYSLDLLPGLYTCHITATVGDEEGPISSKYTITVGS